MPDPRYERWAEVLTGYSVAVQPGDVVGITGGTGAEPLLRAVSRQVLLRGGRPVVVPVIPEIGHDLLTLGDDAQLDFVSPVERFLRAETDVLIRIEAPTNTKALSNLDPSRQQRHAQARTELHATFLERAASGALRWTLTLFPTDAVAQDAEMATDDFADFLFAACKLHTPDPVAAWRELSAEQQRLISALAGADEVRIVGPETDLRLSVKGRTWNNSDGKRNFPSGEIFTGPIEESAEGSIRFTYPAIVNGRELADVRLRFERGKVVEASAAKNEEYLHRTLDTDVGARFLGEFAFGTNFDVTRFTRQILLDEKIGGTVHLALGAGYPETGSRNRSAVHWDLIRDLRQGGTVTVDGRPFLVDGRFVV